MTIGAGYGIGKIGSCAVESMARQPEVAGNIQTAMLITAAMIEGIAFLGVVVCLVNVFVSSRSKRQLHDVEPSPVVPVGGGGGLADGLADCWPPSRAGRRRRHEPLRAVGLEARPGPLDGRHLPVPAVRCSGSSPGSRSPPGWTSASGTSPTRSPRPRPPTSRPRNRWPTTNAAWPPPATQVRAILEQGRRHAEQISRELLDKAKHEAQAEHQRALRQIEAAADAAVKELADQSAAMAVGLAGQILHAEIKPRDHARLIDQAVAGFVQTRD